MGFCFFNNVAVGALHALDELGLSRVAIVDFDVHHGNGTEHIFQAEPRVLMASTFQSGLYPGSGEQPLGPNMKNVPLAGGSSGQAARQACELHWMPDIRAFAPELILISAGFDAHADDQLAGLNWHEDDYAWLTGRLVELAEELGHGRIVSVLEGGYALPALGRSAAAHVNALWPEPAAN
jgi:acetoin utilization deacetylase AcuC-like enzyme